MQHHCKSHDPWEYIFLHKEENSQQLFYFQQDYNGNLSLSKVDMNSAMSQTTFGFKSSAQFGNDLYRLPKLDKKSYDLEL